MAANSARFCRERCRSAAHEEADTCIRSRERVRWVARRQATQGEQQQRHAQRRAYSPSVRGGDDMAAESAAAAEAVTAADADDDDDAPPPAALPLPLPLPPLALAPLPLPLPLPVGGSSSSAAKVTASEGMRTLSAWLKRNTPSRPSCQTPKQSTHTDGGWEWAGTVD